MMSTRVPWPGGSGALGEGWLLLFSVAEFCLSELSCAWLTVALVSSALASTGGFAGGGGGGGEGDAVTLETLIVKHPFVEFPSDPAPVAATSGEFDPANLNESAQLRAMLNGRRTAARKTAEDFAQMRASASAARAAGIQRLDACGVTVCGIIACGVTA